MSDNTIPDTRFAAKTIIITGAGGNFGRAGCLYFSQRGANIAALDNNEHALYETINEVQSRGYTTKIEGYTCDVTCAESVRTAVDNIHSDFGKLDMLWNNAGYQGQVKPTLEYDCEDFARVMNINVTGMFTVLQSVAKKMVDQRKEMDGSGSCSHPFTIVNTASVAGLRGTPAMVAYASSKAAILAMTVSTSKDLAPHGIRVNAISPALIGPGFMWTRQNELHASSMSPYFSSDPEKVASGKINSVPMKRLGSIEEVVKSVAFLLSEDSSYTTAFNMVVDGGMSGGIKA